MRASSVANALFRRRRLHSAILGGLLTSAAPVSAATFNIDFETYKTGSIITTQYLASHGVTFSADNYRDDPNNLGPNSNVLFHTSRSGTPDPDLEWASGWSAGNMNGVECRKILVVAESVRDVAPADGFVDQPDDESVGGTIFVKFNSLMTSIGFDLIDVELNPHLDVIEFRRNGAFLASVSFDKYTTPGNIWHDPTVTWLDRSANRIKPMTIERLGIGAFDEVRFYMPECAGIDNIVFSDTIFVPEPTGVAPLALGAAAMVRCARRRRRG